MYDILNHVFSWPTWWQLLELLWLLGIAGCGYRLYKKEGWFAEPITTGSMFWEVPVIGFMTVFLTTDFQLEGLFIALKYHYVKEALKHDHKLRNLLIISAVALVFIIIAL